MFLRNEIRKIKTGKYKMVHYCKDCDSENIRFVCNKCGSHNIGYPLWEDMVSDNKKGMQPIYEELSYEICQCDLCGKEFDRHDWNQFIYYQEGEFGAGSSDDGKNFKLDKDICNECMITICSDLNSKLDDLTKRDYIFSIIDKYKK